MWNQLQVDILTLSNFNIFFKLVRILNKATGFDFSLQQNMFGLPHRQWHRFHSKTDPFVKTMEDQATYLTADQGSNRTD